jgi:hypothetical protein
MAGKARALLAGRREPECHDVRAVLFAVMRHRVIPSYLAAARGIGCERIVRRVRDAVPAPDGWRPEARPSDGWLKGLWRRLRGRPAARVPA